MYHTLLPPSSSIQVSVVFLGVGQLVKELQQQNPHDHSQREGHFQTYAGQYMQDIGLDSWISTQGGMVSAWVCVIYCGAIRGKSGH